MKSNQTNFTLDKSAYVSISQGKVTNKYKLMK